MFQKYGKELNDRVWSQDLTDVTEGLTSTPPGSVAASHALGVIQARAALAAQEAATSMRQMAIATVVLAAATVFLALVTIFK